MEIPKLLPLFAAEWHIYGTLAEQPDFGHEKAPVNIHVSRGSLVETAGIENTAYGAAKSILLRQLLFHKICIYVPALE